MLNSTISETDIHLRLEELMHLWDRGELSQVLKEYVIKYLPFLQLVNQHEFPGNISVQPS
ncbi:hypothetical protein [Ferruginibacter sp. HRS2-29]|uniref:hypothetical protein n=1 Tax=Ferruginibacter sp. HRS2-29 TaxID=2487334 RepID=UPI0020CEE041|nr:hypothetical protein [Ferruginibacter sp. HRS2-29]